MRTHWMVLWVLVVIAAGCAPKAKSVVPGTGEMPPQMPATAAAPTDAELGKSLYVSAIGSSGQVVAFEGGSDKYRAHPSGCAQCHGADGRGVKGPKGMTPAITYAALREPHGAEAADYPSDEALRQAIVAGVEPNGDKLALAMPRFKLSDAEWAALLAYLKSLDKPAAPRPVGS